MTSGWIEQMERCFPLTFERDFPLGQHTTYRVGGSSAGRLAVSSMEELERLGALMVTLERPPALLVLGRGSNMLVSDEGFDGLALELQGVFSDVTLEEGSQVVLGGGVALPQAARQLAGENLLGFEWAVGIPGSIGGAVVMNAGGHGSEMAQHLISVELLELNGQGSPQPSYWREVAALGLAYRHSNLPPSAVVLRARLQLERGDGEQGRRLISEIVSWRREHQPGGRNAGSVFVNPPQGPKAAELIEGAGLKGRVVGGAYVSEKHANFIQGSPDALARDVYALICEVRESVAQRYGVELKTEIRMVGFGGSGDG